MSRVDFPFDHAIIRFSCLKPEKEPVPRLVFASVEMLPNGRATADETPLDDKGFPPSLRTKVGRISFRRVALDAKAALDWYRRLDTLPDAIGPHVGCELNHGCLADEPTWSDEVWPSLVVPIQPPVFPGPMDDDRIDPFTGANLEAVRVHRRLAVGDPVVDALRSLSDEQRRKAFQWLRLRTWVDFDLYPELLGSAALVVPDPKLRKLRMRLDRDDEEGKTIVVAPDWRSPADENEQLQLIIRERRYGGIALAQSYNLTNDGPTKIRRPQPVHEIGWELFHPTRGVIAAEPMTGFMRSLNVNLGVVERTVNVTSKDGRSKTASSSTRTVNEITHVDSLQLGTPIVPIGRLAEGALARRSIRASASELWLDNPTQARDVIHRIMTQARTSIMLVDPYADGLDIKQYGFFRTGAALRVLTEGAGDVPIEDGIALLRKNGRSVEVRQMCKKTLHDQMCKKTLHDRFLVIDDAVWLLGSSLNGIGNKATMLVRLSAPQPVRERLEVFWANASPIETRE